MKSARLSLFFLAVSLLLELPTFAGDKTAPTKPLVIDDGVYTSSSTQLHAKWMSSDRESAMIRYRYHYHIRQDSISGPIIVGWTPVGRATEITRTRLNLISGKTYYIGVRAINREGERSEVGYSDGITVQASTRPLPSVSLDQGFGADMPGGEGHPIYPDDDMKPVTIQGKRFYSDGKPYFLSTHFLMVNPNSSHVYFSDSLSETEQAKILNDIKSGGYNSIFLYTLNQGDYGGKSVSPYQSGIIGGAFDDTKIRGWRNELINLIGQGIRPILWLVADESPAIRNTSTIELKRYIQKMVQSFDDLPVMWVLGLEVDEYWTKAQADDLGTYLQSIANNPVGIHQLRGQTGMMTSPWVEFAVYQEGFQGDWTTIYSSALEKQATIGNKPLLFAEYEHGIILPSFQKGLAAAFAGSAGVGNGAPGALDEFMSSLPDNMVPSRSGNKLYLTGSGIVAVADLINLTFSIQDGPR
jgi:hypothetical protein